MRVIVTATAVIIVVSSMLVGMGFAQPWSQASRYNQCVDLASQQGLNAKSKSGRRFVARCMQRESSDSWQRGGYDTWGSGNYRRSRNCPDDPKARSAFPAWMCP